MQSTLGELAQLVGGTIVESGSLGGAVEIRGANSLADVAPFEITLVDSEQRIDALRASKAAAAVVPANVVRNLSIPLIVADEPHQAFEKIVRHLRPARVSPLKGVDPTAVVHPSAVLADGVIVGPLAVIGADVTIASGACIHGGAQIANACRIGCGAVIYSSAVLYEETRVGDRSIVHAGAVLGAHGFGYRQEEGRHVESPQLGWVEIENDVEIGANTTIDRGTYGPTTIGEGTKIDNQVQIGHNCKIGRHNIICSQVGVAGSTTTGDYVVIAGQVGVRDHIHIGDHAVISAMAGLSNDVAPKAIMMGIPATPVREQKLKQAALAKLPAMRKEFKAIKQAIADLQAARASCDDAA